MSGKHLRRRKRWSTDPAKRARRQTFLAKLTLEKLECRQMLAGDIIQFPSSSPDSASGEYGLDLSTFSSGPIVGPSVPTDNSEVVIDWLEDSEGIEDSQYYAEYGDDPTELVDASEIPSTSIEDFGSSYSTADDGYFADPTNALGGDLPVPDASPLPDPNDGGSTLPPELDIDFGDDSIDEPSSPFGDDEFPELPPNGSAEDFPESEDTNPLGNDSPFESETTVPSIEDDAGFGQIANSPSVPTNIIPQALSSDSVQLAAGTKLDGKTRYVLGQTDCNGESSTDVASRSWTVDGVSYTETITTQSSWWCVAEPWHAPPEFPDSTSRLWSYEEHSTENTTTNITGTDGSITQTTSSVSFDFNASGSKQDTGGGGIYEQSSYGYVTTVFGQLNGTIVNDWGDTDEGGMTSSLWSANWEYETVGGHSSSKTTDANGAVIGENGDGHHRVSGTMGYNFYSKGDYWYQIDGGRVVGKITGSGSGETSESRGRNFRLISDPSDAGNYAHVDANNWGHSGNLSHSSRSASHFGFEGDGSFNRSHTEDGASWQISGMVSEVGSFDDISGLTDGYMTLGKDDKWVEVTARGTSSTASSFETNSYGNGTYQHDVEGGVVIGTSVFEGTNKSSTSFSIDADLTGGSNWDIDAYGQSDEFVSDKFDFKGGGNYAISGNDWATTGTIQEEGNDTTSSDFHTVYDFVDDDWVAIRGHGSSFDSSRSEQDYAGIGNYASTKDNWSLSGTMQDSGKTVDTASSSVRFVFTDDVWQVAEGSGGTSFTSKDERSSLGSGAYSRKLDGGLISGTLNTSSAALQTSNFATGSEYLNGAWVVDGAGTSFDSDSQDYGYTGNGSYTKTEQGLNSTSSLTATVSESGKDESKSAYQYQYTLEGDDWELSTGSGTSSSVGNTQYNASGTGTFSETIDTGSHSGTTAMVDSDTSTYTFSTNSTYNLPHPVSNNDDQCIEVDYVMEGPDLCIRLISAEWSESTPNPNANEDFWRVTGTGNTTDSGGTTYTHQSKGAFADSGDDGEVAWQNAVSSTSQGNDNTSYSFQVNYSLETFEGKDSSGDTPPDGSSGVDPGDSSTSGDSDWEIVNGFGGNSATGSETVTLNESGSFTQTLTDGSITGSTTGLSTEKSLYNFNSTANYDTAAGKWDVTGTGSTNLRNDYEGEYTGGGSFSSAGKSGKMSWTSTGAMNVLGKDATIFEVTQTFALDADDNWQADGGTLLSSYFGFDDYDMLGTGTYSSTSLIDDQLIDGTSSSEETRRDRFEFTTMGKFVAGKWDTSGTGGHSSIDANKQTYVGSGTFTLTEPGSYLSGKVTQEGFEEDTSTIALEFTSGSDGAWKVSRGTGVIVSGGKDRLTHEGKGTFTTAMPGGSLSGTRLSSGSDGYSYGFTTNLTYDTKQDDWSQSGTGSIDFDGDSNLLSIGSGSSYQEGKRWWTNGTTGYQENDLSNYNRHIGYGMTNSGGWEINVGTGGAGGLNISATDTTAKGEYTFDTNGGDARGKFEDFNDSSDTTTYSIVSTYTNGEWSDYGSASFTGKSNQKNDYLVTGDYGYDIPGAKLSGDIWQVGSDKSRTNSFAGFFLGSDGGWKLATGSIDADGEGWNESGYKGSGTYSRTDGDTYIIGGTVDEEGEDKTSNQWSTSSTNSGSGWTRSGTATMNTSGHGLRDYLGSGILTDGLDPLNSFESTSEEDGLDKYHYKTNSTGTLTATDWQWSGTGKVEGEGNTHSKYESEKNVFTQTTTALPNGFRTDETKSKTEQDRFLDTTYDFQHEYVLEGGSWAKDKVTRNATEDGSDEFKHDVEGKSHTHTESTDPGGAFHVYDSNQAWSEFHHETETWNWSLTESMTRNSGATGTSGGSGSSSGGSTGASSTGGSRHRPPMGSIPDGWTGSGSATGQEFHNGVHDYSIQGHDHWERTYSDSDTSSFSESTSTYSETSHDQYTYNDPSWSMTWDNNGTTESNSGTGTAHGNKVWSSGSSWYTSETYSGSGSSHTTSDSGGGGDTWSDDYNETIDEPGFHEKAYMGGSSGERPAGLDEFALAAFIPPAAPTPTPVEAVEASQGEVETEYDSASSVPYEGEAMPEAPPVRTPRQPVRTAKPKRTIARDIVTDMHRRGDAGQRANLENRHETIQEGIEIGYEGQRTMAGIMPGVGTIIDAVEVVTGTEAFTNREMSTGERVWGGVMGFGSFLLPFLPKAGKSTARKLTSARKGAGKAAEVADATKAVSKKASKAGTTACFPAGTPTHGDPIGGDAWYDSAGAFLVGGIAATVAVHGAESRRRRRRKLDGDDLLHGGRIDNSPESDLPEDEDIVFASHGTHYQPGEYEQDCAELFRDDDDFWRGDDAEPRPSSAPRRKALTPYNHDAPASESGATSAETPTMSTLTLAEPRSRTATQPKKRRAQPRKAAANQSFGLFTKLCIAFTVLGSSFGLWNGWQADHTTIRPIEEYQVGQRVIVDAPAEAVATDIARVAELDAVWNAVDGTLTVEGVDDPLRQLVAEASADEITRADYRKIIIRAQEVWPDGTVDVINVETLQPWQWLHNNEARVGSWIALPLDVQEMGLSADLKGKILDILPCPSIQPGRGRIVLTTVNHLNSDVRELTLQDESGKQEQLQATAFHKFYSVSHGEWVSASELQPGESLDGVDGRIIVVASCKLPGKQRVYNFTVQGQHLYRVADCGVLVHNTGCDNIVSEIGLPGGGKVDVSKYPDGSFSITEKGFSGYPEGVARPEGPFRILGGSEYEKARKAANNANKKIRQADKAGTIGKEIHEVKPVKFGGSPTDPANKVALPTDVHRREVTPWWNRLLRSLKNRK